MRSAFGNRGYHFAITSVLCNCPLSLSTRTAVAAKGLVMLAIRNGCSNVRGASDFRSADPSTQFILSFTRNRDPDRDTRQIVLLEDAFNLGIETLRHIRSEQAVGSCSFGTGYDYEPKQRSEEIAIHFRPTPHNRLPLQSIQFGCHPDASRARVQEFLNNSAACPPSGKHKKQFKTNNKSDHHLSRVIISRIEQPHG
jgi:hypothetical protein